jgi:methylglutaconyl-CoA hydratase
MLTGKVQSVVENGIGEITFSSEKANALSSTLLENLIAEVNKVSNKADCKVIYLRSVGKSFCAGAYFDEVKSLQSQKDAEKFFSLFGLVTVALREANQPVVIRMQGKAVGGGVGLAASGDLVFGEVESFVKLSEFEVGIGPFVISPILESKIGASRLMELALLSDWKDSSWCQSSGLLTDVFENPEVLDLKIQEQLTRICSFPSEAVANLKQLVNPKELRKLVLERAKLSAKALLRL